MAQAKRSSKRMRRKIALPAVGAAGVSLALTGAASAASAPIMDRQLHSYFPGHEITLGEEEMFDVSLATLFVFDHENRKSIKDEMQLAQRACGRCGGRCAAGRCAVGRCGVARCAVARCGVARCAGCRGCGVGCSCSCCFSWGFCRVC
jgi:hypothetical protein